MKKIFTDNRKITEKIVKYVIDTIFKLPSRDLLDLYLKIQEELEKRGVLSCLR